jgi:hypothetical protein
MSSRPCAWCARGDLDALAAQAEAIVRRCREQKPWLALQVFAWCVGLGAATVGLLCEAFR